MLHTISLALILLFLFLITHSITGDEENIIPLCLETLDDNNSVLIFCPTKNWCEKLSDSIAREFYGILKQAQAAQQEGKSGAITPVMSISS